nr:hypothetical protein B0A51_15506 [Rachicladosporium sp. CCFEE 5018]
MRGRPTCASTLKMTEIKHVARKAIDKPDRFALGSLLFTTAICQILLSSLISPIITCILIRRDLNEIHLAFSLSTEI